VHIIVIDSLTFTHKHKQVEYNVHKLRAPLRVVVIDAVFVVAALVIGYLKWAKPMQAKVFIQPCNKISFYYLNYDIYRS